MHLINKKNIINFKLNKKLLNSKIYQVYTEVEEIFYKNNFLCFIVGGAVRDFILKPTQIPTDIDSATNAKPDEIKKLFKHVNCVGQSFGVSLVEFKGFTFEITTFRKEGPYLDKRHPSFVEYGNLFEDSCRRDFTFNALYYSAREKCIYDFHNGIKHIQQKKIFCVGEPQNRFNEDALRILRLIRFASQYEYKIDSKITRIIPSVEVGLKSLPYERIVSEIYKVKNIEKYFLYLFKYLGLDFLGLSFFKNKKSPNKNLLNINKIFEPNDALFFKLFSLILFNCKNEFYLLSKIQSEVTDLKISNFDKKLILWLISCVSCFCEPKAKDNDSIKYDFFDLFKKLIKIENIVKEEHLKKYIKNIYDIVSFFVKSKSIKILINKLKKQNKSEVEKKIIGQLKMEGIPEHNFGQEIVRRRFSFL